MYVYKPKHNHPCTFVCTWTTLTCNCVSVCTGTHHRTLVVLFFKYVCLLQWKSSGVVQALPLTREIGRRLQYRHWIFLPSVPPAPIILGVQQMHSKYLKASTDLLFWGVWFSFLENKEVDLINIPEGLPEIKVSFKRLGTGFRHSGFEFQPWLLLAVKLRFVALTSHYFTFLVWKMNVFNNAQFFKW